MKTKTNKKKHNKTMKNREVGKKWVTALHAAKKTLNTTGSLKKANIALKKQALLNARKLFGSVGQVL
jgi:hypothetical protein